jgi:hypothetical protein
LVTTDDAYPPVRITVIALSQSGNGVLRDEFIEFCRTEAAATVFERFGYSRLPSVRGFEKAP